MNQKKGEVCSLVTGKTYRGNCWSQVILGKSHGQLSTTGNWDLRNPSIQKQGYLHYSLGGTHCGTDGLFLWKIAIGGASDGASRTLLAVLVNNWYLQVAFRMQPLHIFNWRREAFRLGILKSILVGFACISRSHEGSSVELTGELSLCFTDLQNPLSQGYENAIFCLTRCVHFNTQKHI